MLTRKTLQAVLVLASLSLLGCGAELEGPDDVVSGEEVVDNTAVAVQGLTRGDVDYRAWQWVNAGMLYCSVPNRTQDGFCGYYCNRTGAADTSTWNAYRSDCSGLVSWAWGVPAPGWNTAKIYGDTAQTQRIGYWDMQMGDAITTYNASTTKGHTMIFHGWNSDGSARIFQELSCGNKAQDRAIAFVKNSDGSLTWTGDGGRVYWPVRKKVL